jgi:hypothetical protein
MAPPCCFLGGSKEDNLFNHPESLAGHLDTLVMAGGKLHQEYHEQP